MNDKKMNDKVLRQEIEGQENERQRIYRQECVLSCVLTECVLSLESSRLVRIVTIDPVVSNEPLSGSEPNKCNYYRHSPI